MRHCSAFSSGDASGTFFFIDRPCLTEDPLGIFRVWDGGMASHGGILGLVVFSWIYARRHRISWTGIGDNLVAVAPIGLFFGRIANFINGELYGRITTVPWAMQFPAELLDHPNEAALVIQQTTKIDPTLNNVPDIIAAARHSAQVREILAGVLTPRHPSQLYEAFLEGILLFILLILIRLKFKKPDGVTTGCFFILYPVMRIVGEFFREPDAPLTGPFTRGQFLSLFMLLVGAAFLWNARRKYIARSTPPHLRSAPSPFRPVGTYRSTLSRHALPTSSWRQPQKSRSVRSSPGLPSYHSVF